MVCSSKIRKNYPQRPCRSHFIDKSRDYPQIWHTAKLQILKKHTLTAKVKVFLGDPPILKAYGEVNLKNSPKRKVWKTGKILMSQKLHVLAAIADPGTPLPVLNHTPVHVGTLKSSYLSFSGWR